jgi:type VI secretion system protein ImpB
MANDSSQKFLGRIRPPRVQIEYDVELYGSVKKVELPFVMAVMSDLSNDSNIKKDNLSKRKLLEIDAENFNDRMAKIKPGVKCKVKNTLTGEGDLSIDLDFESMADFEPGKIVNKIPALNTMMKARTELLNLMTYMDGKEDAEDLMTKILDDPELLKSLSESPKSKEETKEV